MNHKDWKGQGWYRRWNPSGKYDGFGGKYCESNLSPSWTYEKLEKFEPPKPPREKLPDGLYHAEIDTGDYKTIQGVLAVHDGVWDVSNTKGVMLGGTYTVKAIGRIPTEPITGGKDGA